MFRDCEKRRKNWMNKHLLRMNHRNTDQQRASLLFSSTLHGQTNRGTGRQTDGHTERQKEAKILSDLEFKACRHRNQMKRL
jgi:hypothetical protein